MAPIFQSAALCFMALCGLKSAYAAEEGTPSPSPVAAGEDAYLALNLARRGGLSVRLNALTKQQTIVDTVVAKLTTLAGDDCGQVNSVTSATVSLRTTYPKDGKFTEAPWNDTQVVNILHVLWSASTEVGCAVTTKCTDKQLLVCQMTPKGGNGVPFSEEFYKALVSRTDSIESMTEADLKTGSNSGSAAVPSVLLAGLVAMLATAAA
ncbi:SAG family member [Eimeria necatrix]|uniref:SAG family member n=1 Tax=Eimeria necatrix TaxID=51315 RepID=U6MUR5_9EIME|nr:SAG family member [Eimeria necatrix]CDJ65425.1 SAG family member [Eimeria necatrix]